MGDNAPPEFVWFRFESTDGTAIRQPEPVEMKEEMLVMHFQAAVHASYKVTCGHCGDGELKTFVGGGYLGKATKLLDVWKSNPWSEEKPLIVKVPSADGKRRGDDCNMTEDEDFPPRKKFASAQWKLLHHDCPTLTLDPSKMLVHIPWKVLEISGATFLEKDCDLQLHCRSEVVDEWREIQRNAVDTNAKVVICGAPGTGKTCAAFAFAFGAVDRDLWDIVWIHYASEFNVFRCYMIKGPQLWAGNAWNSQDLEALFFSPALEERRTILFYDGYNKQHPACHPALVCCHKWRSRDRITRRLVIVTSMVSSGKDERPDLYQRIDSRVELPGEKPNPWLAALEEPTTQVECDRGDSKCRRCAVPEGMNTDQSQQSGGQVTETLNVSVFKLLSWTIDEYRIAVREDDFFDSVERVLRDGKALGAAKTFYEDRVALVEKKFYVAGGSARMMFALTTTMAMDSLGKGLSAVDLQTALARVVFGGVSDDAVDRLVDLYRGEMARPQKRLVSSYVVRELGIRLGPKKFLAAVDFLPTSPSVAASFFEGWFIGCLALGPVTLTKLPTTSTVEWLKRSLVHFDIAELQLRVSTFADKQWLVPFKCSQSSYDVVLLDKTEGIVRFVQTTGASKHGFVAKSFCDFLQILHACKWMEIRSVELCYVVPRNVRRFVSEREFSSKVGAVTFADGEYMYRPSTEQTPTRYQLGKVKETPIACSVAVLEAAYDAHPLSFESIELEVQG